MDLYVNPLIILQVDSGCCGVWTDHVGIGFLLNQRASEQRLFRRIIIAGCVEMRGGG